jgi:hypothetical protein
MRDLYNVLDGLKGDFVLNSGADFCPIFAQIDGIVTFVFVSRDA